MNSSSQMPTSSVLAEHTRWLVLEEDPFSRQVKLAHDPRFWVRMELPHSSEAHVTDFNPGAQDDRVMAASLELLFRGAVPDRVRFVDLVPAELDPNAHRLALNKAVQSLQTWVELATSVLGREVVNTSLEQDLGKVSMVVELS